MRGGESNFWITISKLENIRREDYKVQMYFICTNKVSGTLARLHTRPSLPWRDGGGDPATWVEVHIWGTHMWFTCPSELRLRAPVHLWFTPAPKIFLKSQHEMFLKLEACIDDFLRVLEALLHKSMAV